MSKGIGVGPGGFEYAMQSSAATYPTQNIINSHNFWIEILSQYGLLVFLGFVLWFVYLWIMTLRIRHAAIKQKNMRLKIVSETLLIGLLGYVFAAVATSSFMVVSTNWMFLSSIMIIGVYLLKKQPV
jgi:teichuronic acid biosynthesis protein TuaE